MNINNYKYLDNPFELSSFIIELKEIVYYFDNNLLKAKLSIIQNEKGVSKIVAPAATCWGSLGGCLTSILINENVLSSFVNDREFVNGTNKSVNKKIIKIKNLINNDQFIINLNKCIQLLKPIDTYIISFQKNSTTVSDVYNIFENILPNYYNTINLNNNELNYISNRIKNRFDLIYGDAHGIGYLLDKYF